MSLRESYNWKKHKHTPNRLNQISPQWLTKNYHGSCIVKYLNPTNFFPNVRYAIRNCWNDWSNMLLGAESVNFLGELADIFGKEEKHEIEIKTSSKQILRNSFEPAESHRHLTIFRCSCANPKHERIKGIGKCGHQTTPITVQMPIWMNQKFQILLVAASILNRWERCQV